MDFYLDMSIIVCIQTSLCYFFIKRTFNVPAALFSVVGKPDTKPLWLDNCICHAQRCRRMGHGKHRPHCLRSDFMQRTRSSICSTKNTEHASQAIRALTLQNGLRLCESLHTPKRQRADLGVHLHGTVHSVVLSSPSLILQLPLLFQLLPALAIRS